MSSVMLAYNGASSGSTTLDLGDMSNVEYRALAADLSLVRRVGVQL